MAAACMSWRVARTAPIARPAAPCTSARSAPSSSCALSRSLSIADLARSSEAASSRATEPKRLLTSRASAMRAARLGSFAAAMRRLPGATTLSSVSAMLRPSASVSICPPSSPRSVTMLV